jgi:hypothetical protein
LEVQVALIVSFCAGVVIQICGIWKEAILAIFFFCTWFLLMFFVIGRYTLDVDLKTVVTAEKLEATASRVEARKVSAINISYTIVILKIIHFHLRCLATGRII